MMPSPMRAEYHRLTRDSKESTIARAAISTASRTTVVAAAGPPRVIALTTLPASTGVATPMIASSTTATRKTVMSRRYGPAKLSTRRAVARPILRLRISSSRRMARSIVQPPPLIGCPTVSPPAPQSAPPL
jgi:hypothetical protein